MCFVDVLNQPTQRLYCESFLCNEDEGNAVMIMFVVDTVDNITISMNIVFVCVYVHSIA